MSTAPIQNIDSVDLVAVPQTGGVHLFIVVSGRLDESESTQRLLLSKIESYLEQLNTPEFQDEFDNPAPEKTCIVVATSQEPHPIIIELLKRCLPWVRENNATLKLRVDPADAKG